MADVTKEGFKRKSQNEYFTEERDKYLLIDPEWNLDPSTPDGLKLAHDAEQFGNLDEALHKAYNSKDPNAARDHDLDVVCSLTGTRRKLGTPSTIAQFEMTGVPGTTVPALSRFESETDGSVWEITQPATIAGNGKIVVPLRAVENGATQVNTGEITRIVTAVGGLQSVTNLTVATPGTDKESNPELRLRRKISVGRPGNNQIDSTLGEVGATEGVRHVKHYENDDNTADSNGLPPHSVAYIVDGGTDEDVALSLYLKKNPGVKMHAAGTAVTKVVTSPKHPSNTKSITFSRPIYVDVNVDVTIKNDGTLPDDAAEVIKDAIMLYTSGALVPPEYGFRPLGFTIAEDVPVGSLYTPINSIIGKHGNSYVQSLTINGSSSNLVIAFNALSRWIESNITVNIV